ncbi:MAG: hypothetical protein ACFE0O_09290 [Opitutales bacterium]
MRLPALRSRWPRRGLLLLFLLTALPLAGQELFIGMTRAELVATAGNPTSSLAKGGEEILLYPGGIRIEIRDGAVYRISGTDDYAVSREAWLATQGGEDAPGPSELAPPPEPEPTSAPAAAPPPEPAPTESEPVAEPTPDSVGEAEQFTPEQAKQLFDEAMAESASDPAPKGRPSWASLLIGGLTRFFITLIILYITFKVLGVSVFIDALSLIALVDVLVKTGVEAAVFAFGFPTTFYLDSLVALLVMLVLVQKLTAATTWPTAVKVVITVQVVGILVGYLLFMVLLNTAFSF